MQGDVPTNDLVFGATVLAIFLVFVFALGYVINRFKNARFAKVWHSLIPIVGGKVIEDGGGAATSWLVGTYKGRSIRASMMPRRNRYSGETGFYYNYFDVALLDVNGKQDWSLPERTADRALAERLHAAGALAILRDTHAEEVVFNAKQRTLTLIEEPGASWLPSPSHFEKQLNVLLRLADVNQAVN